mmetsp:Transcript_30144/g.80986  ORF Transcript_30144/g.80986 Transcript_30144/m.80986 type:complete len:325 (+) Transcript_30144:68-1042(+)
MLSSEEMNAVYGGTGGQNHASANLPTERGGAGPSIVDMPGDDMGGPELNPQSLAFEEISVNDPSGSVAPSASAGRLGDATNAPFLPSDAGPKSYSGHTAGAASADGGGDGASGPPNVWQLAYYKPLFDVDSHHIVTRVVHAVLPRPRAQFFELISPNPDLYGPFWIATTLIFVIAVTGNLAKWMTFTPTDSESQWSYDFTKLTGASTAVYMYVSLAPLGVWASLRYMQATKRLVDMMCIYGYALASFVPISLVCIVPSSVLRWITILCGCAVSAAFLVTNIHAHLQDCFPYSDSDSMRRGYALLAAVGVGHVIFSLVLKVCFFA